MLLRSLACAAIAATSFGAQAALTTYAPWDAVDGGGSGLAGVLFNVQTANGVTVALGAHGYKNSILLPNNGNDTYYARAGLYQPAGSFPRANWSFDTMFNLGTCTTCKVFLGIDTDPTAGVTYAVGEITSHINPESWNIEFAAFNALLFNPFSPSSTGFELFVTNAAGERLVTSEITVNVPEPGTMALMGIALAGMGLLRRRKA